MPTPFETVQVQLSAVLTTGGTLTVGYPAGRSRGDYLLGTEHRIAWNGVYLKYPQDFSVTLNAASAVFTINANVTMPANAVIFVQFDRVGGNNSSFMEQLEDLSRQLQASKTSVASAPSIFWSIGSPLALDTAGAAALQTPGSMPTTIGTALQLTINGTRAAAGKAYPDIARNLSVTCASNMSTQTVGAIGVDVYGNVMCENITGPNATTVYGKKSFARIDQLYVWGTGTIYAFSIGFGKTFGLPISLVQTALVLKELQNGAIPTAGTFVAADYSTPTATTGDVRGTWTPNATLDGTIALAILFNALNFDTGAIQYAGP